MVNENKNKVLAAVAGAVVGAGAVLAGAIAMADKTNQNKVGNVLEKAKEIIKGYGKEANKQTEKGRESVKKIAGKAIKKAEQVTKIAKKGVSNL